MAHVTGPVHVECEMAARRVLDAKLADVDYCYITTIGRVSGKPHTVEIWFGASGDTIYVLAGSRHDADFVRNAKKQAAVTVRIAKTIFWATRESSLTRAKTRWRGGSYWRSTPRRATKAISKNGAATPCPSHSTSPRRPNATTDVAQGRGAKTLRADAPAWAVPASWCVARAAVAERRLVR
jgi:hypothetical protein